MAWISYSVSILENEVIRNNEVDPNVLILKSCLNGKHAHVSLRIDTALVLHTGKMQMHIWTDTYMWVYLERKIIGKATHQAVNSDCLWESM